MYRKTPSDTPAASGQQDDLQFAEWINRHSGIALSFMIFCIALSALLAFAVLRPETKERKIKGAQLPLNAGMDGFTGTAIALSEVLRIHSEIEDILSADSLSLDDSIRLEKALKQFEAVQERLKQSHNSPPKIIDKPRQ